MSAFSIHSVHNSFWYSRIHLHFALKLPVSTGLFKSPSGISELDCATTKTDTAERSISIGRESLQFFFVLGALAYFQVPPLGGSREENWRSQWIRKRSVSWNLPKLSQLRLCNGGFGSCATQNHLQTKQFVNGTWIPAEWLPVRCETNRPSGPMGPDGYPLYRKLGGPPSSGLDGCGKSRPPPGFVPRTVQPVACRQLSLFGYPDRGFSVLFPQF